MTGIATVLDPAPAPVWDRICRDAPAATFFHTRAWAEILARTYPELRIAAKAYELEDGTTAVLPLVERPAGFGGIFRSCESMAPGVYGGILADGEVPAASSVEIYRSLAAPRIGSITITGNPWAADAYPDSFAATADSTQVLDLGPGFESVLANVSRGNRHNAQKAMRSGLRVEVASTPEDVARYYDSYLDSQRRWGDRVSSRYPLALFLEILACGPDRARLWLVESGEDVLGGIVTFYHGRHVAYWHGAFFERSFELRPSNLVHIEAIRDACERGFQWYDFNPSGGHEGVVRFKQTFHPRVLTFTRRVATSRMYRTARRLTRFARR